VPTSGHEIEVKFYVQSLPRLRDRLIQIGGRLNSPRTHELNLRFDAWAGDLLKSGRLLRLRSDQRVRLTYKDESRIENGVIDRRELEFGVDDLSAARQVLEALGFQVIFTYEKYRTTYELEDATLMLDELPYGNFVEIEGVRESLEPLAARLGLNWQAAIPRSYHALFRHLRDSRKLQFENLLFEYFSALDIQPGDLGVIPADR
jgi:adenylate cyclase, class 2